MPPVRRRATQRAAFLQFVTCQAAAGEGDFRPNAGVIAQHASLGILGSSTHSPSALQRFCRFPDAHGAMPVSGMSTRKDCRDPAMHRAGPG
ncbi:hypothetical protein SBADM41S_00261 [Streptomyces badius]